MVQYLIKESKIHINIILLIIILSFIVKVDPFKTNSKGKDAYDIAKAFGHEELAFYLEKYLNETLNFQERKLILIMR